MTAYEVLGVAPDASEGEIRAAYRGLIRVWHPDVVAASGASEVEIAVARERSAEINVAWEVLSDSVRRAEYDVSLVVGEPVVDVDEGWETIPDSQVEVEGWEVVDEPIATTTPTLNPTPIKRTSGLHPYWWAATLTAALTLPATLLTSMFAPQWAHIASWVPLTLATLILITAGRRLHQRSHIISFRKLKPQHMYGQLGPDPQAGRIDLLVWDLLNQLPHAVAIRSAQSSFSHVVVAGDRAVLLRGLAVEPGCYHWQSTSLVSAGGFGWESVATVDWPTVLGASEVCRRLDVQQQVVLYPTSVGVVDVADGGGPLLGVEGEVFDRVAGWLAGGPKVVRHDRVVEAVRVLFAG